jgi:hypothetical protein
MQTLYYALLDSFSSQLKKYMLQVPRVFMLVYEPTEKTYCILGTDRQYNNWEQYANYVFTDLETALEFPETILRLPAGFEWIKIG